MRIRTMAAFAAGVMVAAAGTALATTQVSAIVGTDNQIHGCYLTSAGLLRVVPQGSACGSGESAIAWSATGSGAPGPKGDPGVAWRGAWVSGTAYNGGDLVRSAGKVWLRQTGLIACFVDRPCSNTIAPAGAAGWSLFAADGQTGPVGPRGPAGPPGASSTYLVHSVNVTVGPQIIAASNSIVADRTLTANCPSGTVVTGGGYDIVPINGGGAVTPLSSRAAGDSGWRVRFIANGLLNQSRVWAWATCARLD